MLTNREEFIKAIQKQGDVKDIDLVELFTDLLISARDLYYAMEADFFLSDGIESVVSEEMMEEFKRLESEDESFIPSIKSATYKVAYDYESAVDIQDFLYDLKEVVKSEIKKRKQD